MLLVSVPAMMYAMYNGWMVIVWWLLIGNSIINIYPILVQRYNCGRVHRLSGLSSRASV